MQLEDKIKRQVQVMYSNFFRNDDFKVFLIGLVTVIFHSFSQNESVILKMDSCTSWRNKRNTHMLYDCRDTGGFVEVTLPKSVQNTMATCGRQYRF